MALTIGAALFASSLVTPLYDIYQARWHFSSLVLTLVYATYAIGVLVSLRAGLDRVPPVRVL